MASHDGICHADGVGHDIGRYGNEDMSFSSRLLWYSCVGHLLLAAVLLKISPSSRGTISFGNAMDVAFFTMDDMSAPPPDGVPPAPVGDSERGDSMGLKPAERSVSESRPVTRGERPTGAGGTRTPSGGDTQNNHFPDPTRARILARLYRARYYPAEAYRRGLTGRPVVEFAIRHDGTTTLAKIITSSGIAILDTAALQTIRRAEPLPYYPEPLRVPITFKNSE